MTEQSPDIAAHYQRSDIVELILAALARESGAGAPVTVAALSAIDHFHGRNLAATEELAKLLAAAPTDHVLDIGCGIGGPARWLATTVGCRVTGIDLTPAFCDAARRLNEITGLAERISIVEGDATRLPFADATFDRAWSHNVVMNIADKARFYGEARRVLKPGATLALAAVARTDTAPVRYPTPWAETAASSFLSTVEETRREIEAAGFDIEELRDSGETHRAAQAANGRRVAEKGLPKLGVHVFVGDRTREHQVNMGLNAEAGAVSSVEVKARRRA